MSTNGKKPSFSIGHPFALDVKWGENIVFEECLVNWERNLVYLQMSLQVSSSGGDQTPKWLPSSPKGEIVGIMKNVLSLMATYLIRIQT